MDDLAAFLRGQWDAEEKRCSRTPGDQVLVSVNDLRLALTPGVGAEETVTAMRRLLTAMDGERIDPARVLAEVEAKRRILDLHHVQDAQYEGEDVGLCCSECGYNAEYSEQGGWCETVRLLALPYADVAGYREEWRP